MPSVINKTKNIHTQNLNLRKFLENFSKIKFTKFKFTELNLPKFFENGMKISLETILDLLQTFIFPELIFYSSVPEFQ